MKCSGLHCPGCGHHGANAGIGAGAAIAVIVLAVIVANRRAIGHAASVALHILEIAAEVAAGLAVATAATAAVLAIRRRVAQRATASAIAERAEIPASVRVLAPRGRAHAQLPASQPSGHSRWPYVDLAAWQAEQDAADAGYPERKAGA